MSRWWRRRGDQRPWTTARGAWWLAVIGLACAGAGPAPRVDPDAPIAHRSALRLAPGAGLRGTYRVLLPPGYPAAAPYPVVYFLHGLLNTSDALWQQGVARDLELGMAAGTMPPFVLVAPDGGWNYWSDAHDGSAAIETWVTEGLRQRIESEFAVRRERAGRAIAGISMGGYGALKAALRRPDLYAQGGSLSGAILRMDWDLVQTTFWFNRVALKRAFGATQDDNSLAENDLRAVLAAAAQRPAAPRAALRLGCGSEDKYGLAPAAQQFHEQALAAGFASTLRLEPGDHDWRYWRQSTPELLRAMVADLAATPAQPE